MIKYEKIDSKECSMKIELVDIDKAFKYYQINDIISSTQLILHCSKD